MCRIVPLLLCAVLLASSFSVHAATTEEKTVIVNSGTANDMGYYFNSSGARVWAENYSVGATGAIYVADYDYLLVTCGAQTSAWMHLVLYTESMAQTRVINFNATSGYRINLAANEMYMKTSVIRGTNNPTITGVKVVTVADPDPGPGTTTDIDLTTIETLLWFILGVLGLLAGAKLCEAFEFWKRG